MLRRPSVVHRAGTLFHDTPLCRSMRVLWGLHGESGRWTGVKVMVLRDGLTQGVIANAELEVTGDTLTLHAYLGLRAFGQSRTWHRANAASRQTPPQAAETR